MAMAATAAEVVTLDNPQPAAVSTSDIIGKEGKLESQTPSPVPQGGRINLWRLVSSYCILTPEVSSCQYVGRGTDHDPFIVDFLPGDPLNPHNWPTLRKWVILAITAVATFVVSFCTSAYLSATPQLRDYFHASDEVITLGLSLFILGFALGPLAWGPLSEEYGRQPPYLITYSLLTVFNIGAATSKSIATLLVLRFLAGAFGASPLTNSGGVIADMFNAEERGVSIAVWAACAFIGPAVSSIPLCHLYERLLLVTSL